ncbi:MAG TPA: type II toxin-antitoxin system RelE/ParE family toxin [Opitutaceae bacterium]|jgi:proteic killer suppression protein|nr:type II toxin-antitoxin system RelE/ParE family toxin [Opitutaceae bacterium]
MILSFRCEATKEIYKGDRTPDLPADIQRVALRKLQQLDIAQKLDDLRIPPGNRLEPLKGDRKGQHSIRINHKYRICFIWTDRGIEGVEIVDYH